MEEGECVPDRPGVWHYTVSKSPFTEIKFRVRLILKELASGNVYVAGFMDVIPDGVKLGFPPPMGDWTFSEFAEDVSSLPICPPDATLHPHAMKFDPLCMTYDDDDFGSVDPDVPGAAPRKVRIGNCCTLTGADLVKTKTFPEVQYSLSRYEKGAWFDVTLKEELPIGFEFRNIVTNLDVYISLDEDEYILDRYHQLIIAEALSAKLANLRSLYHIAPPVSLS